MALTEQFGRVEGGSRQLPRALSSRGVCAAFLSVSACSDMHAGADVDGGSGACATCHMPEYLGARRHAGVKPTTCGVCHSRERWTPHIEQHRWPLTGAHAEVDCVKCHTGAAPKYEDTASECVDCHLDTFEYETFAEHLAPPLSLRRGDAAQRSKSARCTSALCDGLNVRASIAAQNITLSAPAPTHSSGRSIPSPFASRSGPQLGVSSNGSRSVPSSSLV